MSEFIVDSSVNGTSDPKYHYTDLIFHHNEVERCFEVKIVVYPEGYFHVRKLNYEYAVKLIEYLRGEIAKCG